MNTPILQPTPSPAIFAVVLDTETTGTVAPHATEIAYFALDDNLQIVGQFCKRYNPQKPIEAKASQVTGIYDNDVKDCPPHSDFVLPSIVYLIGHHIRYDMTVLKNAGADLTSVRPICTCLLARHYFSDLKKFSLGALFTHFYPEQKSDYQKHGHSALFDVQCTYQLLMQIIQKSGIDDLKTLYQQSLQLSIPKTMPFGKYKGQRFDTIPKDYKEWLLRQKIDEGLRMALII